MTENDASAKPMNGRNRTLQHQAREVSIQSPSLTLTRSRTSKSAIAITLVMGILSISLYFLLFLYADTLTELAMAARNGNKVYALIPIGIALLFSFVHGVFTGKFWDLLGLKAKK